LWFHLERQKEVGRSCWVADAFTETPGGGNPAAIVLLDSYSEESDADWCRTVAKEFNLAETAFIWRLQGSDSYYGIRYYTMNGTEITLCGHATLAASVVIFQQYPSLEQITFSAKADELIITPTKYYSGKRMQVTMNFPRKTLKALDDQSHAIDMLERAIPALKDRVKDSVLYTGLDEDGNDLLIEVEPDFFHAIDNVIYNCLDWSGYQRGVIICCLASTEEPTDFLSRFFAPKAGILEDPVTGSAHCTLAPYFGAKLEKTDLQAEQCSTRRGKIQCSLLEGKRVALTGSAIITVSGSSWI
jgi:PhzF family phenazine biosynthesis protein